MVCRRKWCVGCSFWVGILIMYTTIKPKKTLKPQNFFQKSRCFQPCHSSRTKSTQSFVATGQWCTYHLNSQESESTESPVSIPSFPFLPLHPVSFPVNPAIQCVMNSTSPNFDTVN